MDKARSSLTATLKDDPQAGKRRVGEVLCKEGYISSTQLEDALNYQKKHKGRLGSILINLGYIEDQTIMSVLSRLLNFPALSIQKITPEPRLLKLIPYEMAKKYMAFPIRLTQDAIEITMAEPTNTSAVADFQIEVGRNLKINISSEKEIIEAYKNYYKISDEEYNSYFGIRTDANEIDEPVIQIDDIGSLVSEAVVDVTPAAPGVDVVEEYSAGDAPIVKLVNSILTKAITEEVSDIHIEPFEKSIQVRYRLDGALYQSMNLPISIKNAITSRLKILSGLNIAERRIPQDGRIKMQIGRGKTIDFRVSTLPTLFGESSVLRILDQSALNVDLKKMGFETKTLQTLEECIYRPFGLILVTGPTGSGKTTTLYSVLNNLNSEDIKILTAEDPIEFNFRGINQVAVNEKVGMTFAAALRAFLRQDPDIIMVGEIRDRETAEIAIKAAMTGHLVLSTLHTNDSPSTIGRLIDIGIPPYMVSSAVSMVLSQRLARRLCPECKVLGEGYDPGELEAMGFSSGEIPNLKIYEPEGCSKCNGSGYKGRIGLFELMEITEEVGKIITAAAPEDQLRKVAMEEGMVTLRTSGLEKIRQGVTSIEEVIKRTIAPKMPLPDYLLNSEIEKYEDKEAIFKEGDRDSDFFLLVRGALMVGRNGKKIAEIAKPGEYFGEMAALTGKPRNINVISRGKSAIRRFPGDKLPEIIENNPDVAKHLFETMSLSLNHSYEIIGKLIKDKKGQATTGK